SLSLTAGKTYSISYRYGNNSSAFVEKLKVSLGVSATVAAMTTQIADHPSINQNAAQLNTVVFTVPNTGNYTIGFQAYSVSDQFSLYLDDIFVEELLPTTLNQASGVINFTQSFTASGDITITGVTDATGQGSGVTAAIGMSFTDTNPSTWNQSHSWKNISYSTDNSNADVYSGNIGPMYQNLGTDVWYWSPGVYYYATRFTYNSRNYYGGIASDNIGGIWDGVKNKNGKLKILTQVRSSQANTTYKGISIPINAVNAVNAINYTFEFRDASTDSLIAEITSTTASTNFAALGVNATSRTYKIRVKSTITGGETLDYGTSVNITLDLSTALRPNHCGLVVANHSSARFDALPVLGATNYQFEVTVNGGTPEVVTTTNPFFTFSQLSSLPGNSATIGVRVKAEVGGIYQGYGATCNVFTRTQITQLRFSQCSMVVPAVGGVVLNAIPVTNASNYDFEVTVNGGAGQIISSS
ncbi:MAG: hypothetical protein ACOVOV_12860, partial [Dolichospermum sp.]